VAARGSRSRARILPKLAFHSLPINRTTGPGIVRAGLLIMTSGNELLSFDGTATSPIAKLPTGFEAGLIAGLTDDAALLSSSDLRTATVPFDGSDGFVVRGVLVGVVR
jgi:hypothetical protein